MIPGKDRHRRVEKGVSSDIAMVDFVSYWKCTIKRAPKDSKETTDLASFYKAAENMNTHKHPPPPPPPPPSADCML